MIMMMKKLTVAVAILAATLMMMAGCSSTPSQPTPAETPQPKAPEAITGSSALFKCYIAARGWAQDAQPFRAESVRPAVSKGQDGKALEWRTGFASPSMRSMAASSRSSSGKTRGRRN